MPQELNSDIIKKFLRIYFLFLWICDFLHKKKKKFIVNMKSLKFTK